MTETSLPSNEENEWQEEDSEDGDENYLIY
jgi:hypothetical protein